MSIRIIGIAGAGTMGLSMAQSFAKYGYSVKLYDLFPEALDRAKHIIGLNQETEVNEGVLSAEDSRKLLSRITYEKDMQCFADVDFLIEAIKEDLDVKREFWAAVSAVVPDNAILASNTSGLSITKIADAIKKPERFCGMHWINPPHIIPLVEVIKGEKSSDDTTKAVYDLAVAVGKKPVTVKDAPGFALNRIQFAIMRECLHIAEQGIASIEDVDNVMKYGLGIRYACLGPFQVADLGGLDIFYNIASYLFADLSNAREPFYKLKEHAENKEYGVKSGKGFYDYSDGKADEVIRFRDETFTKLSKCLFE